MSSSHLSESSAPTDLDPNKIVLDVTVLYKKYKGGQAKYMSQQTLQRKKSVYDDSRQIMEFDKDMSVGQVIDIIRQSHRTYLQGIPENELSSTATINRTMQRHMSSSRMYANSTLPYGANTMNRSTMSMGDKEDTLADIQDRMKLFVPEYIQEESITTSDGKKSIKKKSKEEQEQEFTKYIEDQTNLKGFWLNEDSSIGIYKLAHRQKIIFQDTKRLLLFKTEGDEKIQTLKIDESKNIEDIIKQVSVFINLQTDVREYLFYRDMNKLYSTGVQTKKANIETSWGLFVASSDSQIKKYRQHMKTDDDISWLSKKKTLREEGIGEREVLVFGRRYFGFTDAKAGSANTEVSATEISLSYSSYKRNVLCGALQIEKDQALNLAVFQYLGQVRVKDYQVFGGLTSFKDVKAEECLPPDAMSMASVKFKKRLFELYTKQKKNREDLLATFKKNGEQLNDDNPNLPQLYAKRQYVTICKSVPLSGTSFFMVKAKPSKEAKKLMAVLFGVNKDEIMMIGGEDKKPIGDKIILEKISSWVPPTDTLFILKIMPSEKKNKIVSNKNTVSLRTPDGLQILQLLQGYVNLKIEERRAKQEEIEANRIKDEELEEKARKAQRIARGRFEECKRAIDNYQYSSKNKAIKESDLDQILGDLRRFCNTDLPDNFNNWERDRLNTIPEEINDNVSDLTSKILGLANLWNSQGSDKGDKLIRSAQQLMDALAQVIDNASTLTGDEFAEILNVLSQQEDNEQVRNILNLMDMLNITDNEYRKGFYSAINDLANAMKGLLDGAMNQAEFMERVDQVLGLMAQNGLSLDDGLGYRMKLMQEARNELIQPSTQPRESTIQDINNGLDDLIPRINEIYANSTGQEVDDEILDELTLDFTDMLKAIAAYSYNLEDQSSRMLREQSLQFTAEMSKLLEHQDRNAKNLNLENINICVTTIRAMIPRPEESEKSQKIKHSLAINSKKLVDSMLSEQGLVVRIVPIIEEESQDNARTHEYFREVALDLVNQTETLGNVVNLSMHITELNPESHLNPVVNCADLTKMKVDQLIDQMRQYFQKHNFEDEHGNPSDLTNAVRDVTTCLNNLLNGIKFYDNDNYQTAVEFSAIIENPTVSNKFATLDDAKQEALSSICNVISAIPDLKTEQDKALTTVSRNTLEAAVALSHISAVEPHQHSICIAWVNSITGLIVDSLNNPNDYDNLNVDDVCNTTSMLLNSLGLESYGNFKAALIAAVTKVVQETAKLGFVTQEHNSYSTEGKVATSQAMHLSKLIRVLAPIAEHVDILPQVEQPIQELENTVAVCHNTNSQEVNLQANNTEVAITELRNAIEQFPKSTAFQLRNAVKDIDVMFTDVVTKLDEINNDEEVDDDASEEDPEVVAANAIAALFNKDILNEVVEVSSFAKQLVIASAALQREKIAKDKWLRENRPELFEGGEDNFQYHEGDFDHGLVSAALNVVRAIGALCKASTDMVDGEISPEYLIVTSQFVAECCTQLVVASKVSNIDRKGINPNLEKLIQASEGIKKVTNKIVEKTEAATHFKDTGATDIKIKLSGNLWRDELNLQDYENKLYEKVRKLHKEIKDRRRQGYAGAGTKMNKSKSITDDSITELMSAQSIDSNFKKGLKEQTSIELKLKEQIKQTEIIIEKVKVKLAEIKAERVKPGDESD